MTTHTHTPPMLLVGSLRPVFLTVRFLYISHFVDLIAQRTIGAVGPDANKRCLVNGEVGLFRRQNVRVANSLQVLNEPLSHLGSVIIGQVHRNALQVKIDGSDELIPVHG
jgi:hypothetical protein